MNKERSLVLVVALALLLLPGCTRHEIEARHDVQVAPIEIKPIHITIDLNIKVDRALDDFFGDLDQKATTGQQK
jgi:hypothetical protein